MKYCIEDLKDFAESKNGKCLSNKYNNSHTKYKWQCECGHIWESTWSNILHNNSWCSYCAGNLKKTLENCQKLAEKNNGKCLSKEYINNKTKMIWQCGNGHIWNATLNNILNGSWCPYCKGKHIDILDAQKLAEKNKGICLSQKYVDCLKPMKWQCSEGHIFKKDYSSIKQGQWCPYCVGLYKTIQDMQKLAEKNGGKCLSKKYIDAHTKLKWKCEDGHIWKAKPNKIQQGQWCPYCKNKSESKFREVIEKILCADFSKIRPKWLKNKNGHRLELDGYNKILKVAFEYQGKQHFKKVSYFGDTKKRFEKRQEHDRIKKQLCKERNIILLCPTYKLDSSEYENFIIRNLEKQGGFYKWH